MYNSGAPNLFAAMQLYEPPTNPPNRAEETSFDKLVRLDAMVKPGLTETEFRKLFAKCRCGKVTTHWAFKQHISLIVPVAPVVIDLTHSDDNSVTDLTTD